MPHTYSSNLIHCVFSTKNRVRCIKPEIQGELWSYMGGIARNHSFQALAVGGAENHAHALLLLPPVISVSKAMQTMKAASSKWLHETQPNMRDFAWREAYGAFSVSISHANDTVSYILNQTEHHKKRDFQQEFLAFLKKHNVKHDPAYVWG
jgi:putative transposase